VAVLVIVVVSTLWTASMGFSGADPVALQRYRVEAGDTLWAIARQQVGPVGDPRPVVADIREANGLATSALDVGDVLVVPVP
jgi:hypothetical protein